MRARRHFMTAAIAVAFLQISPAHSSSPTCETKRADIQRSIAEAKAQGQTRRLRGLEKALREVQDHCSDAGLAREHAARIAKQEKKVAERQRDLDKARTENKAGKIADREAKLAREKAELEALRAGKR